MFLNSNSLPEKLHSKYCIIGSGVGGSSVIEALLKNGKNNFILIEAGGKDGNSDLVQSINLGRSFNMPLTRSIQLGGTTNIWGGGFSPLDDIDFEAKDENGVFRWPFTKDELLLSYAKAASLFGIPNLDLFNRSSLPKSRRKQIDHLKSNKNVMQEKIFQIPLPLYRFKERLEEIFKNSNTRHCVLNSPALELLYSNGTVTAVKVGTKNAIKIIEADNFIICAGALETPRLLLNSNIDNPNIGRFLMDHPKGYVAELDLKNNPLPKDHIFAVMKYYGKHPLQAKAGFILNPDILKDNFLLNHNVYIKPIYSDLDTMERIEKLGVIVHTFRGSKSKVRDLAYLFKNSIDLIRGIFYKYDLKQTYDKAGLFIVAEQTPSKMSRVRLGMDVDDWGYPRAQVDWHIKDSDLININKYIKILIDNLGPELGDFSKGCIANQDYFKKNLSSAAHHMGTARMGASIKNSVVDANLKVFGFDNLYICDASIFPSGGNANPSLTISALAFKAVKKIIL